MPATHAPHPTPRVDSTRNWIIGARRLLSPNCDERPAGAEISLIVLHGISLPPRSYGGPFIDHLFTNTLDPGAHEYFAGIAGLRVSSHVLVDRRGTLTQYVPFSKRAWHAGQSCFQGREACNDFSIGVELEGCDDEAYCDVQYEVSAALVAEIMRVWPAIAPDHIARHSDIAPERKTDPGPAFDWDRFRTQVSACRAG